MKKHKIKELLIIIIENVKKLCIIVNFNIKT